MGCSLPKVLCPWDGFAMPSSRGSSQPRDQTQVFHLANRFSTVWTIRAALVLAGGQQSVVLLSFIFEPLFPTVKSVCQKKIASDECVWWAQCGAWEFNFLGFAPELCQPPLTCLRWFQHSSDFHKCSCRRPASYYVSPWLSRLVKCTSFLTGITAKHEVFPPPLLQAFLRKPLPARRRESLVQSSEALIRFQFYFNKLY